MITTLGVVRLIHSGHNTALKMRLAGKGLENLEYALQLAKKSGFIEWDKVNRRWQLTPQGAEKVKVKV